MQIPETANPHFQHAFKKGYRMALEGRSVNSMPSDFRRDMELRRYFQEGWEQAVEDSNLAQEQMNKPDWKHRFVWFLVMLVGGLATALHIINLYNDEQTAQQNLINTDSSISSTLKSVKENNENHLSNSPALSLLNEQSRQDIKLNQQETQNTNKILPLSSVIESPIKVTKTTVSSGINNGQPTEKFNTSVPKYVRNLYFFTTITNANQQTIYHRWRTDKQILATIELPIKNDQMLVWSNKKLSSAWQGQWYLEVLNDNKDVIYRQAFTYANQ